MRLNPIIGGPHPTGPSKVPEGPAWARRRDRGGKTTDIRSKKAYTGSKAGIGRRNGPGTAFRQGPGGPRRFAPSVQLPHRSPVGSGAVVFTPGRRPSLMTRIGRRLRGGAAALGL